MLISDVIRGKGDEVFTITPDAAMSAVVAALGERRVGALVVSRDGEHIDGIVSERDVVRRLHTDGAAVLDRPVEGVMTRDVIVCAPGDNLEQIAQTMTDKRIRHLPVVVDDRLVAIVSIGDIVKSRMDELQVERDQLVDYIHR